MDKIYGTSIRQDGLQRVGRNRWDLFYGFGKDDDNEMGYNWRTTFDHKPTTEEVKSAITEQINSNTKKAIVEGYNWDGVTVWLSDENQRNYTLAYNLSKDGILGKLPTVKLGSEEEPVLHTFKDATELTTFVQGMQQHIQSCLESAWDEKEQIDWSIYA